ncbi:uncharacterized protein LOC124186418 [Neodiprion fabricii]|uniref:uncharacterized protein LOC124186418 n=1 Tax=Neodiprion fabricii TaxID=2872261 RepID=UPI001ED932AD|nr:uncharacterized protein LOC124186418 [Neodiprion fabricii]XP_046434085.1 uncharacterized protein LOC124186418 [Neodiprion fabricii]
MDHWQMFAFFFVGSFFKDIWAINIKDVRIPKVVREGTEEPIILDCNYEMGTSSNTGLTIKWHIGPKVLYQWVQGSPPRASEEFHKYVDVSYKASNNSNTMYRAVKLVRPGLELSGNYRCVVWTHDDEVEEEERMVVYSPENYFTIHQDYKSTDESNCELIVTCLAKGLSPLPTITLRKDMEEILQQKAVIPRADGRYEVKSVAVMDAKRLRPPVTFKCEIHIQDANYTNFKEVVYSSCDARLPRTFFLAAIFAVLILFAGNQ